MIEIEPRGSYFKTDDNGFLINPATVESVQPAWRPVIDEIVKAYRNAYRDTLVNVYLRGSVAKGEAIEGVSDIDTFASVDLAAEAIDRSWRPAFREEMAEKYPFVNEIDLTIRPVDSFKDDNILLIQSVCIWGKPFPEPRLKPGKAMAIHAKDVMARRKQYQDWSIHQDHDADEIASECGWLMKGFLRLGFELTMERSKKYTRDLYRCYETFAEYYPDQADNMHRVLHLALNPTSDRDELDQMVTGFGEWLYQEAEKDFAQNVA